MRLILIGIVAAATLAASLPAAAHGGSGHSRARVGFYVGAPLIHSAWQPVYPHPYYGPPAVVVPEVVREPLVFYDERGNPVPPAIVQTGPQSPAEGAPAWFFCPDSQGYYPRVRTCASTWQRVMPHPPPSPGQ